MISMAYIINMIGLCFDITGVILLFIYGVPSEISKTGAIHLVTEQTDDEEVEKWKKYNKRSKIGLTFICIGFIMQFVSSYIQFYKCN